MTAPHPFRRRSAVALALAVAAFALVAACGSAPPTSAGASTPGFPLTVKNCGVDVTLPAPPKRVVLVGNEEVSLVAGVGALDRVVAKIGDFPRGLFGRDVDEILAGIPNLNSSVNGGGGVQASLESVINTEPDLVVGYETPTLTRAALEKAGIPLIVNPSYCGEIGDERGHARAAVSFANVYDEVALFGRLFGEQSRATTFATSLRKRVAAARAKATKGTTTAAALYVGKAAGLLEAYGNGAVINAELEAAGLTNVYGEEDKRVFTVSTEDLLERDPDVLVLLSSGDPDTFEQTLRAVPGTDGLTALRSGRVLAEHYSYGDPATPLTVSGLEHLVASLGKEGETGRDHR
ncbi:ABC transporter substrate-binding protein [Nocardioides sp. DS6]|uniref:ABC transporter substrate-binding protein n=1 Tax=Nocardioides eburneus TaxID=3231482 RepID=A0ABV3SVL5_9ACTN